MFSSKVFFITNRRNNFTFDITCEYHCSNVHIWICRFYFRILPDKAQICIMDFIGIRFYEDD